MDLKLLWIGSEVSGAPGAPKHMTHPVVARRFEAETRRNITPMVALVVILNMPSMLNNRGNEYLPPSPASPALLPTTLSIWPIYSNY